MKEAQAKTAVVGVGNLLLKDEGVGIHTAHALQKMDLPDNIEIIDGGTSPDLPFYFEDIDKLVIIDAVKGGGQPGTVYRFNSRDVNMESDGIGSAHEFDLAHSLKTMKLTRQEPKEIVIIGIEPKDVDWGTELSVELQQKIPGIVDLVLKEVCPQQDD
jgi:hydrogenase maturation protease